MASPADDVGSVVETAGNIVAAYLSRNEMKPEDVPGFIRVVRSSLSDRVVEASPDRRAPAYEDQHTADSIKGTKLNCLECGKWVTKLAHHIENMHRLAPHEYRSKWNLPANYPMDGAVARRRGVDQTYLECLECRKHVKVLKIHLRRQHDLTPEEYRNRWGLPEDYPLVAPAYSEARRQMSKKIGFGTERTNSRSWGRIRSPKRAQARRA